MKLPILDASRRPPDSAQGQPWLQQINLGAFWRRFREADANADKAHRFSSASEGLGEERPKILQGGREPGAFGSRAGKVVERFLRAERFARTIRFDRPIINTSAKIVEFNAEFAEQIDPRTFFLNRWDGLSKDLRLEI